MQLIEDTEEKTEDFWGLPAEVLHSRAVRNTAREASSVRHRQHPAVGYARVPVRERPTWEGSAAQDAAESGHDNKEDVDEPDLSEVSGGGSRGGSDEDSDDSDQRIINNTSRRRAVENGRERRSEVTTSKTSTSSHYVLVVFGEGTQTGAPEVWLGIRLARRGRPSDDMVRIQFLQEAEEEKGTYFLTSQAHTYDTNMVEHTFPSVDFVVTTTCTQTHRGKKRIKVDTRTTSPLNQEKLAELAATAAARVIVSR